MKATVKKWGNSAAVRIPAAVMQARTLISMRSWMCARRGAYRHRTGSAETLRAARSPERDHRGKISIRLLIRPAVGKEVW